jgi:hypothetical protein
MPGFLVGLIFADLVIALRLVIQLDETGATFSERRCNISNDEDLVNSPSCFDVSLEIGTNGLGKLLVAWVFFECSASLAHDIYFIWLVVA